MGTDKARLVFEGETLLDRAVRLLSGVADEVVLACGPEDRFPGRDEPRVLDGVPDGGPLAGLAAALRGAEGPVLALACDMPFVTERTLRALLGRARSEDADVVLARHGERAEPLLAVYHARVLPAIEQALARGRRRLVDFHADVRVTTLEVEPRDTLNLNTPEDLRATREERT